MSAGKLGDRDNHQKFCLTEDWEVVRNARGKPVRHHTTYKLALPDSRILRTRISHPVDRTTYSAKLWGHILDTQLEVTEQVFWSCVDDGTLPDRGTLDAQAEALPVDLAWQLINKAGHDEAVVAKMSLQEALEAMNAHWMGGAKGPG